MSDMQELKQDVKQLLQQQAVHNELLRTHEARSLALQSEQRELRKELEPIKAHVNLVNLFLKGAGLITVGAVVQAIVRYLL